MEKAYSSIGENIRRIRAEIADAAVRAGRDPADVQLMAVTKTVATDRVNAAIDAGIRLLGENKAQELCEKFEDYHKQAVDIHFIGHLQTNKVRQIADKVSMVHSVGSAKLAGELSAQAAKLNKTLKLLIEVNIAGELSKSGVSPDAVEELAREIAQLPHLQLQGLMTIPPFIDDDLQTERYFSAMQQLLVDIEGKKIDNVTMNVLSMGMSGDYVLAIKYGATILRLGSSIFGYRT